MKLDINNTYHGFTLIEERILEEIKSVGKVFEHKKSGAKLLHIGNDDDNKVFSISFKTPPDSNNGLTHILEHSVLCGSRKFPSKEPFIELIKGSLNTFLNALTFPDKTMYPVASRNEKDFFNLMDVYLDAVFYPNIYKYPEILMQEGWHYNLEDSEGEITYKGVVYNEMKGAFSSPEGVLLRKINGTLYPNTQYAYIAGGDPDFIPQLTQEEFVEYHRTHYHPSNSYIYLYGNGDLEKQLKFLNESYLNEFEKIDINTEIPLEKAFNELNEVTMEYPISNEEEELDKTYFALNFSVGKTTESENYLAFDILQHILLGTSASPLKKAIIEAGIGNDVFAHYDNSVRQMVFSIVLKNSNKSDKDKFISIIYDTLKNLSKNGIDKKLVKASMNSKEFELREADFRGFPKGVIYNMQSLDSWMHGESPFYHLLFETKMKNIKTGLNSNYFEGLIDKYLLNNKHCSLLTYQPKKGLGEEKILQTSKELNNYKLSLSHLQLKNIIDMTNKLKKRQNTPDNPKDLENIPMLKIEDIEKKAEVIKQDVYVEDDIKILYHPLFTNNITYINLIFDLRFIDISIIPYVSLLSDVIGKIGTKKFTYDEVSQEIDLCIGDIKFAIQIFSDYNKTGIFYPKFTVKIRVLTSKIEEAFDVVKEILNNSIYDNKKRLKEIIREIKSRKEMKILSKGYIIALQRTLSYICEQGKIIENTAGLSYFKFISEIEKDFDSRADEIVNKLKMISDEIFTKNNLIVSMTCGKDDYAKTMPVFRSFINCLREKPLGKKKCIDTNNLTKLNSKREALVTQSNVQFVAQGFNFKQLGYTYCGAMQVLENILKFDYLWNILRVQGGAYGALAAFEKSGNCYFVSIRDPYIKETLDTFKGMEKYFSNFNVNDREMKKYIIGTISSIDAPLTPAYKGERATEHYIRGITKSDLQKERDEIITCNQNEIISLSTLLGSIIEKDCYCVLGNESKINENKDLFDNFIKVFD